MYQKIKILHVYYIATSHLNIDIIKSLLENQIELKRSDLRVLIDLYDEINQKNDPPMGRLEEIIRLLNMHVRGTMASDIRNLARNRFNI